MGKSSEELAAAIMFDRTAAKPGFDVRVLPRSTLGFSNDKTIDRRHTARCAFIGFRRTTSFAAR